MGITVTDKPRRTSGIARPTRILRGMLIVVPAAIICWAVVTHSDDTVGQLQWGDVATWAGAAAVVLVSTASAIFALSGRREARQAVELARQSADAATASANANTEMADTLSEMVRHFTRRTGSWELRHQRAGVWRLTNTSKFLVARISLQADPLGFELDQPLAPEIKILFPGEYTTIYGHRNPIPEAWLVIFWYWGDDGDDADPKMLRMKFPD